MHVSVNKLNNNTTGFVSTLTNLPTISTACGKQESVYQKKKKTKKTVKLPQVLSLLLLNCLHSTQPVIIQ